VSSARYSDMLVNELKPAIRSKRRGLLSKRVLLLQDNARPHTAAHTMDTLRTLKSEVLNHPPYRPDLAPSGFHLCGPMKEHLRGQTFPDDDEVMEAVQSCLTATPKSLFLDGIRKLMYRWTKCVAKQGDYVEKLDTNNFCKYSCKKVILKCLLFNDLPSYIICKNLNVHIIYDTFQQ